VAALPGLGVFKVVQTINAPMRCLAQVLENDRGPLSQRNLFDKSPGLTKQYRQQLRVETTVPMRL